MRQARDEGHLPEVDGHRVAWESWGDPSAPALVLLHGGPGGGISDGLRQIFDPAAWRIVAIDQRGCGRSLPHAGRDVSALEHNTTEHLVADIERLRRHLGLDTWVVFGGSWGATLAQVYAHTSPAAVQGLLLAGVTQTRAEEIDWLYGHLGLVFPEAFAAFRALAPEAAPGRALVRAYRDLLQDPGMADRAAEAWCLWEQAVVQTDARHAPSLRWQDPVFRLGFARLCAHYFSELGWIDPPLDQRAAALGDLPGELVHSTFDLSAPRGTAWALAASWPGATLTVLPGGLHSAGETDMAAALRAAADRLLKRLPHPRTNG
jgi:proline iminopeptidase